MTNGPIEQPMTNDELRALVASNVRAIAELRESTAELRESTTELRESTANTNRSVQGLRGELAEGFEQTRVQIQATEIKCTQVDNVLVDWREQSEEDMAAIRASIRQTSALQFTNEEKLARLETSVQNLIEDGRADRAKAEAERQANAQVHADFMQRMEAAEEANTRDHNAFTQNIQTLLAEIARIWQNLRSA